MHGALGRWGLGAGVGAACVHVARRGALESSSPPCTCVVVVAAISAGRSATHRPSACSAKKWGEVEFPLPFGRTMTPQVGRGVGLLSLLVLFACSWLTCLRVNRAWAAPAIAPPIGPVHRTASRALCLPEACPLHIDPPAPSFAPSLLAAGGARALAGRVHGRLPEAVRPQPQGAHLDHGGGWVDGLGAVSCRWVGRAGCKRVVAALCRSLFAAVLSPCLQAVHNYFPTPQSLSSPPFAPPLCQAAAQA